MIGAQSMVVMVLPSLGVVVDNAMFPKDAVLRHRNLCLVRNGPSLQLAPTPHYSRAFCSPKPRRLTELGRLVLLAFCFRKKMIFSLTSPHSNYGK